MINCLFFCTYDMFNYVTVRNATIFHFFFRIYKDFWIKQFWNNKTDLITPVIIIHINIHCKSHTAVTQVTDTAQGPLVPVK